MYILLYVAFSSSFTVMGTICERGVFWGVEESFLEKNVISASVGCSTNWAPEMGTWLNVEPEVSEKL